jgi:Ion channel
VQLYLVPSSYLCDYKRASIGLDLDQNGHNGAYMAEICEPSMTSPADSVTCSRMFMVCFLSLEWPTSILCCNLAAIIHIRTGIGEQYHLQENTESCRGYWDISPFQSALHGCWYTAVTMTTVGYGDFTPKTSSGTLVGFVTMLCGTIAIALPISVIARKLSDVYERLKLNVQ